MPEPVNDVMNEKIYIKISMVFFTLVGIAGGCMSIAGVVVGLTLNPNQLTAANFKQVERFGLDAALYFDCDKVDGAFGQNMVKQMEQSMTSTNTTIEADSDSRTTTTDTFERLCNDRKASHLYIAVTSGVFTIVGMFVFIACAVLKKFEPDFVYIVPLLLSFLMVYDYVETNSSMFAYIKTCTEIASYEDKKIMKLKNIIVWAPYPNNTMGRYGVTDYGKACRFSLEDARRRTRKSSRPSWMPGMTNLPLCCPSTLLAAPAVPTLRTTSSCAPSFTLARTITTQNCARTSTSRGLVKSWTAITTRRTAPATTSARFSSCGFWAPSST